VNPQPPPIPTASKGTQKRGKNENQRRNMEEKEPKTE
jgi:hypothetical protein